MNPNALTWATSDTYDKHYVVFRRAVAEGGLLDLGPFDTVRKISSTPEGFEVIIMREVRPCR